MSDIIAITNRYAYVYVYTYESTNNIDIDLPTVVSILISDICGMRRCGGEFEDVHMKG